MAPRGRANEGLGGARGCVMPESVAMVHSGGFEGAVHAQIDLVDSCRNVTGKPVAIDFSSTSTTRTPLTADARTRRDRAATERSFGFRVQRQESHLRGLRTGVRLHRIEADFLPSAWLHRAAPWPLLPSQPQGCPGRCGRR